MERERVLIIGGGLAGLTLAIHLARYNILATVIEKDGYPKHRVCGEYISNEVVPFLKSIEAYPSDYSPAEIGRFQLSSTRGKSAFMPLDLGGFGISRFTLDLFLYEQAVRLGVQFVLHCTVTDVKLKDEKYHVTLSDNRKLEMDLVIGAHGKRSKLDAGLNRAFMKHRSPYVGVKYHIKTDFPKDLIALHNFNGGYCGVSHVENDVVNFCYLVERDKVKQAGSIAAFEEDVMARNPLLQDIFQNSQRLFERPLVINEVSFEPKQPIENDILMVGDAAGMITPLCGNGMAMAIRSAKIAGDEIVRQASNKGTRDQLFNAYRHAWKKTFSGRLQRGKRLQQLFGNHTFSEVAVTLALHVKPVARAMMKSSHGKPF